MIKELTFVCSKCDGAVLHGGIFLNAYGVQEGFCSTKCLYNWLHDKIKAGKESAKGKEKNKKEKRSRPSTIIEVPQTGVR